jgi:hypothetical protein
MTRRPGWLSTIKLATVPVNIAEYPARKILFKYGTGLVLLYAMRTQYWNTAFASEHAAYIQYKT